MEAILIGGWLARDGVVSVVDEASVSEARERVRRTGHEHAVPAGVVDAAVLIASELARNQLKHSRGGGLEVRHLSRSGVPGLEVLAFDRGPGLADPATALEGAGRDVGSLGVGLASVCALADEVDFDSRVGEGLCVLARKFASEVPRRREVGIYGRPIAGERESGDEAGFVRDDVGLTLAVCDGLGHGEQARVASTAAMAAFGANAARNPVEILDAAHVALAKTRGAVMTVARIDEQAGLIEVAGVGNVTAHVYGVRTARRFGGTSFVLGAPQRAPQKIRTETAPIGPREAAVVFTDGVRSQLALEHELALLRERPVVIAQRVVERFARDGDDVLVLVAR